MRSRTVALLALLLTVSVSGCGDREPGDSDPTTKPTATEPSTEPSSDPSSEPTGAPTTGSTTPPSEALQKVRVVGEVVLIGDCLAVRDDHAITWTITGGPAADLVPGDRVAVTGAPDLAATGCAGSVVRASAVRVLG